ncbi:Mannosyl-glycoprotein endo-beta-N-acetylglucosaminidase [Ascochyta rabiei]|uniref:Mannosyl-glycoprotein endo-beta-N-acetylglucosaminidase n=1 Tax=Didymella rabiei TaxID=5454 RepID=A0A163JZ23_DIDRA|nr:Mannosyl-glycoprotein endo-beta-N-acetylglucosaminidase [Ascochyta rabiei]KZM26675.1 mannosyl-glycoprotein endo-beta-N-acetylglucosaminidase [Ascochyta rabiei]UPX18487.1 Mannosyl-glycoprotein endo-beta-N-acetylglucosaminidase [Ascochyta rabiei]
MAILLGWKDVLRPIRDGYRHLFPAPDTGPTPEERQRQRAVDQLKGFAYFDTFEQLEVWTEADSDPLQRANTPLLVRSVSRRDGLGKANVLLCHDHAGNYHDYEGVSSTGLEDEEYACEYMQFFETFIYFSHKLVCVPPPTWTNALHRNGAKALGTILMEPQTPDSEKLLQYGDDGLSFPLARKLADIAKHYGFDGWLVNIEKPFPTTSWNADILRAFLRQLKSDLGTEKELIWYDALTTSNKVSYQNALSAPNLPFAQACGSILTNYCWKESDAVNSVHKALQDNLSLRKVYFGVDVWAQNTTKLSHPRITYPEYTGGGTNTGVAVAKLAELGLSAGVFAPAWTFEHFPGHGKNVERTMWEGKELPEDIGCSCGDCKKRHRANSATPIARFARQYSAGSEAFFFTDFSRAFHTHEEREGRVLFDGLKMHAQLGSQSVLPLDGTSVSSTALRHRLEDLPGRTQLLIETHSSLLPSTRCMACFDHHRVLPLFKLDMSVDSSLQLRVSFRDLTDGKLSFYVRTSGTQHRFPVHTTRNTYVLDTMIEVAPSSMPCPRLEELGVYVDAFEATGATRLAEVDSICIKRVTSNASLQTHNIYNIRISALGEGDTLHSRINWSHTSSSRLMDGMPFSDVTGPFSYFAVHIDGLDLGRSYAAEHILSASLLDQMAERKVSAKITGIGFDWQVLASASTTLQF